MRGRAVRLGLGAALIVASCGGDDVAVVDDPPVSSAGTTAAADTIDTTAVGGSAPPTTGPPTTEPTTGPTTTPTTSTSEPTMTTSLPDIPLVEQAIADLASRLDADPAAIEVVSVEEVDWPDASIGCPQPGMAYAQVIVNGTRIVLRVDDTEYEYHQGGARDLFYCPPDRVST